MANFMFGSHLYVIHNANALQMKVFVQPSNKDWHIILTMFNCCVLGMKSDVA